jgi:hypothetical protein
MKAIIILSFLSALLTYNYCKNEKPDTTNVSNNNYPSTQGIAVIYGDV